MTFCFNLGQQAASIWMQTLIFDDLEVFEEFLMLVVSLLTDRGLCGA